MAKLLDCPGCGFKVGLIQGRQAYYCLPCDKEFYPDFHKSGQKLTNEEDRRIIIDKHVIIETLKLIEATKDKLLKIRRTFK
jgi:DNA-directed RNA polymerase subunit RPC12/RpoP